MRYVYMVLIFLVTAVVLVFSFQNLKMVTVFFLTLSVNLPLSILVIVTYFLGMVTGGALLTVLRAWIHRATEQPAAGE